MKDKWDSWMRFGLMLGGIYYAHADNASRIDAGKDEQRAHWQAQRIAQHTADSLCDWRKDSSDKAFQKFVIIELKRHVH